MGCAPSQPTVERQRKSEMGVVEVALIFGLMEQQVKTSQRGGSGSWANALFSLSIKSCLNT